ncbi:MULTISPECIES: hypothetical protein [Enterobacterales]|uniref:hypothetical protein n=1 Tax=Enterobacterales TaxID=91347 RepID=UPI0010082817|nr:MULTISPECIES: hypothetical protein [Enterobacterales]MCT6516478.1 hypothetical protein [Proteus vulgaris]WOO50083.1 hypothetical protein R2S03_02495 [Hafnia alvei]WPF04547.1 hypothetical protein SB028_01340 [Proteus vulgaris]
MKLTSLSHTNAFITPVTPCSKTSSVSFSSNELLIENIEEILLDTYYHCEPINKFEEDLYCKLLRHQRDFVPRINLYYSVVINHIQWINNTISTSAYLLKKKNKKRKFSSAFIQICNLAEE